MTPARLIVRWYLRCWRILWKRRQWRKAKALRATEQRRKLLGDRRDGTPIMLRRPAEPLVVRKIKQVGDVPCPQCDATFQWTDKDGEVWKKHCLRCDYRWTIPVEYRGPVLDHYDVEHGVATPVYRQP